MLPLGRMRRRRVAAARRLQQRWRWRQPEPVDAGDRADQFKGVDVTVLTFTGPQIAEPLQRRAPDFSQRTGANIKVVTVPFADLYDKILTDLATGTNSYDAFVFDPQWMGDFVPPGYLEDITDRVKADQALKWDDIAPFFRDFSASYKGRTYTIPLDGDFQMVYYRSDLLQRDGLKPRRPGTTTWPSPSATTART